MATLLLLRHGQSIANAAGEFTGWVDVPLTEEVSGTPGWPVNWCERRDSGLRPTSHGGCYLDPVAAARAAERVACEGMPNGHDPEDLRTCPRVGSRPRVEV